MIWFSGSAEKLTEMVLSIPEHIANNHNFPENNLFKVWQLF